MSNIHLYPLGKGGDPLCPLGFHPQVRWPTRCKRCFRDYKEHGGKRREPELRKDEIAASTPSLRSFNLQDNQRLGWVSSSNLSSDNSPNNDYYKPKNPSSWTSTPDLANLHDSVQANIPTVSLTLPLRKKVVVDTGQHKNEIAQKLPVLNGKEHVPFSRRLNETQQRLPDKPSKRIHIREIQTPSREEEATSNDVQFIIKVKSKSKNPNRSSSSTESSDSDHDSISLAGTETTESTTLVDHLEFDLKDQLKHLKEELKLAKEKSERLEKEKSNILLRRFTAMDTKKGSPTELLKLQQKVNELQMQLEESKDENTVLNVKVKELEDDLDTKTVSASTQKVLDELRSKLLAAENLCEELMDENEDMKKELREMEDEMEEMQDNFREDQADEYTSLKKELEQTTKNCRILSFKLRKTERKAETLENEKLEFDKKLREVTSKVAANAEPAILIDELKNQKLLKGNKSNEINKLNISTKTKLEAKGKNNSGETVPRESLTRGGSQEDPVQLMRDLQDSLEREADLKEQLKFAEEEAQSFRKKATRFEEENESLSLQLKKMATRTKINRKFSETKGTNDSKEKDEDLKLQLELSEQEASILRKKLEELELDNQQHKTEIGQTQEKGLGDKVNIGTKEKNKGLENEIKELRKKLKEKEALCVAQENELKLLNDKKTEKVDQKNLDLKEQLTLIEKEVAVFRAKSENLENENEKLIKENKRLALTKTTKTLKNDKQLDTYLDKIVTLETELNTLKAENKELSEKIGKDDSNVLNKKIKIVEKERDKLQLALEKLKENSPSLFKNRKPCVITDTTPKSQLKTMVNNLEIEIASLLIAMEKLENSTNSKVSNNDHLMKEYKELEVKKTSVETELAKAIETNLNLSKTKEELEVDIKKITDENKQLALKILKLEKLEEEFTKSKESYESKLSKKNADLKKLKNELEEKKTLLIDQNTSADKVKELETQIISNEKKLQENEQNYLNKINDLERMVAEAKQDKLNKEVNLNDLLGKSKSKYEKLEVQHNLLKERISHLEITINDKDNKIKVMESEIEKKKLTENKIGESKTIKELRQEITDLKNQISEKTKKLSEFEENKAKTIESAQKTENELKVKTRDLEKKINELQANYEKSLKANEQSKHNHEKENKNKETEVNQLMQKIKTLESKLSLRKEQSTNIEEIENKLKIEKKNYENLTAKYEVLEEEHVVTKAELVTEKELLKSQIANYQREIEETRNLNLSLEETNKDLKKEKKDLLQKISNGNTEPAQNLEKLRLKALLEGHQTETEQLKKQCDVLNDQMVFMRRENDELKQKIDDYNKVSKIQRNISADSAAMEKEIKELNRKLSNMEKNKTLNMGELKLRYENQITILNKEMQSLHAQISRFRREKDTYKQMLEGAQKTIGELKSNPDKSTKDFKSAGPLDDIEEYKSKIAGLEQQINCMEDELFDARLEASKVKTEYVSEKSSWEVQLSELHSKINEIEEEKILSGGRTKIAGLRTRMELSWQKEREEQQRLLQETATLARDLRQTLFEIERERDKESLESKRKLQQLKKSLEEDQEENKRKLIDLQSDFMELRDAHAKLRTTNDKLRREKERYEKEREEMKSIINGKKRVDQEDTKKLNLIVKQVENLLQLAPELLGSRSDLSSYTPTPPKRTKSKSREGSPVLERRISSRESSLSREDKKTKINTTLQSLLDATEELKKIQNKNEETRDKERVKRYSIRRATSTENDQISVGSSSSSKQKQRKSADSNLNQKSLSLEHTASLNDYNIWKGDDGSITSLQSLNSDYRHDKEYSIDSRMSDGSTKSEMTSDKKKKGFINKIKKLTKSRSIDDTDNDFFSPNIPLSSKNNSATDFDDDLSGSKSNLKERITGMFKRGKSSSRSNSVERQMKHDTSSTQRPLMGIPSSSNH